MPQPARFNLALWISQGFGVGLIPFAPGTFGSVLGIAWTALLLVPRSPWILMAGVIGGFGLSVYCCGVGERCLGEKDPGPVVLDEVTAVPACFLAWALAHARIHGAFPGPEQLFTGKGWWVVGGIFLAFRLFDITKPWPVRGSQALPGGWGITVDDFLAAVYVNLVTLAALAAGPLFH